MHTVMIVTGGLALLAVFCAVGHARAGRPGLARAARTFLPVWLVAALVDFAVGILSAGYPVAVEAPIAAAVFGVPAMAALVAARLAGRQA